MLLGNERIFKHFKGIAIPYTLMLDRNQNIVKIYRGPASKESLEAGVKKCGLSQCSSNTCAAPYDYLKRGCHC